MICFTGTIVSYTTDLQSRGTNFWNTLYNHFRRAYKFSWIDWIHCGGLSSPRYAYMFV